ncbi:AhpC/TSA family protein [Lutibacter sp. Hel_I_33_5]|uniref:TlpA disulfide reductase family protein n=1 Tax=Lutibacter sp. Hel_I_33_5 TaxID=1566289 RepID=UPI0011A9A57F|nr:TlpA disulfide reductase family protein [Lutibacter sp. Hel_I_33_5]TVZ55271.1 AhpC/TSA family protein [Lutibacter sp. Hel_I_33_5]
MKSFLFLCSVLFIVSSCKTEPKKEVNKIAEVATSIAIETVNYEKLKPLLHLMNDKTYVINFWATWCAPCVKELPEFEKLHANYKDKNVEVILVSLDFPKQVKKRLIPFIIKNNIQSKVIHFEDKDEQFWIKDIADNWTGALPATLIYNAKKRKFYEQSFDYETLENELTPHLNI